MAAKKRKKKIAKRAAKQPEGAVKKCTVCRKKGHNARSHNPGSKKGLS